MNSKKFPNNENEKKYTKHRNKLNHLLRITEKQLYQELIHSNKHNLSQTWKIIKRLIGKNVSKTGATNSLHNNEDITDRQTISELFNQYFSNVGPLA